MKRLVILCLVMVFVLFMTTVVFASIDDDLAKIKSAYESGNIDEFKETIFTLYETYIGQGKTKLIETSVEPVKKWSGSGMMNTEPFTIASSPWKLKWNNEGNRLSVWLCNPETGKPIEEIMNAMIKGNGESYVYKKGTFYLTINAIGAWEIEIEEGKE